MKAENPEVKAASPLEKKSDFSAVDENVHTHMSFFQFFIFLFSTYYTIEFFLHIYDQLFFPILDILYYCILCCFFKYFGILHFVVSFRSFRHTVCSYFRHTILCCFLGKCWNSILCCFFIYFAYFHHTTLCRFCWTFRHTTLCCFCIFRYTVLCCVLFWHIFDILCPFLSFVLHTFFLAFICIFSTNCFFLF